MPPYAGFASLPDYLVRRCRRTGLTPNALSVQLGWPRNYLHGLIEERFKPSRTRAARIAEHFGDAPEIVFILAGLQPAPAGADRQAQEIATRAGALPRRAKLLLLKVLDWLESEHRPAG